MDTSMRSRRLAAHACAWLATLAMQAAVAQPAAAARDDEPDALAFGPTLERDALVSAVLERNPTVEAARAAWRAAEARPRIEGALEDPMLEAGLAPLSLGVSDVEVGYEVELQQRFPFPGKRGLRAAVAAAEARAQHGDYEAARLDTALMASMLFDDYWAAERALEINAEHRRLRKEMMSAAEGQYVAGRIPQQALLTIEVEVTHAEHDQIILDSERDVVIARLNALLHRRVDAPLPPPAREPSRYGLDAERADALRAQALELRPELAGARARVEGAAASAGLARRDYLPDVGVGASYSSMWDMPEHRLMAGVSVNVPLQLGRRRAAVDAAEAEVIRQRSEQAAAEDRIAAEVETARRRLLEAQHLAHLYETRILPAHGDRVRSARAGFESGDVDFETVIAAERALRDAQLSHVTAVADRGRRSAELDRAVGRVPAGSTAEPAPAPAPGASGSGEPR
jgi:outer membrane protein TolC